MNHLANYRLGRVALHLLAMCRDCEIRWHVRGILREFCHER